jgi:hypothetical protein
MNAVPHDAVNRLHKGVLYFENIIQLNAKCVNVILFTSITKVALPAQISTNMASVQ